MRTAGLRGFAPDAVLAVAVAGFVLAGAAIAPPGRTDLDPLGFVLLLAGPAALAACRRAPVPALLVTTVCVLGYLLRGYPGVAAALPVLVALMVAVRSGHRLSTLAPTIAIAVVVVADITIVDGQDVRSKIRFLLCGWLVASAILGETFRRGQLAVRDRAQLVVFAYETGLGTARNTSPRPQSP
jgi:hypothetical protein